MTWLRAAGAPDTADALYAFFLGRVRDRLHVVLCFSPVGAKFGRRAQQFPGLISGCTIDWFLPWPEAALIEVASKFIDDFPIACPPPVCACCCKHVPA
jgi:dynein heavy chain